MIEQKDLIKSHLVRLNDFKAVKDNNVISISILNEDLTENNTFQINLNNDDNIIITNDTIFPLDFLKDYKSNDYFVSLSKDKTKLYFYQKIDYLRIFDYELNNKITPNKFYLVLFNNNDDVYSNNKNDNLTIDVINDNTIFCNNNIINDDNINNIIINKLIEYLDNDEDIFEQFTLYQTQNNINIVYLNDKNKIIISNRDLIKLNSNDYIYIDDNNENVILLKLIKIFILE